MPDLKLRWLRYFVAVAEELHFGRAAARLFVSQPTVSAQIRQLEHAVGVPLFVRTSRQVRLTEAGARLLERVRPALDDLDRAVDQARTAGTAARPLTLASLPTVAATVVPPVARHLRGRRPDVHLRLHQANSTRLLAGVADRTFDVALLWRFDDAPLPAPVTVVTVARQPLRVVVPASHRLAEHDAVTMLDLAREDWLVPSGPDSSLHERDLQARCDRYGYRPPLCRDASNLDGMLALVATAGGICPVPPGEHTATHPDLITLEVLGEHLTLVAVGHASHHPPLDLVTDALAAITPV